MANPLSEEKELYAKIEKEKLSIPRPIWELIEHHLGNDVYAITLIASSHITGDDREPIPPDEAKKIVEHCLEIKKFLDKIRSATKLK